ncbi:alkaline phosphatase-like [Montipora capricornis]|uniref:alkaline phosphatase-like n=1 Tax=Montipora capricornis TaxID=246305 RepID=UPI0035F104F4
MRFVVSLLILISSQSALTDVAAPKDTPGSVPENQESSKWFTNGVKLIKENLNKKPIIHTAKNTIIFLGDGMSVTTVTATRILEGQMRNQSGEENVLSWEQFPWTALSKTFNVDQQVPDSAGTATAYLEGVKTDAGVIGVDETVKRSYCSSLNERNKVISILTLAEKAGMSTGFISTARATHATPAALYAHSADRNWESDKDLRTNAKDDPSNCKDIATQLIEYPHGNGIDVIFAGGREKFMPNKVTDPEYPDKKGGREDGRNLIQEWVAKYPNSVYVWNKKQFDEIDPEKTEKVMGLFEPSHMEYEVDRAEGEPGEPSIAEMTEKAINILKKNPKGYFLLVEGGRIDHGHHAGKAVRALNEAIAMAKACATAIDMTNRDDTLLIVTADHSHVFAMAGYPGRGNPIFGVAVPPETNEPETAKDGMPYTVLGYTNGPGGKRINGTRQNLTGVDTGTKDYLQQAAVWLGSETHGGDDVGIYADGPGAYLFHGVVEQQYIFHVMDHAMCLSDSKKGLCNKHVTRGGPAVKSSCSTNQAALTILCALLMLSFTVFKV